MTKLHKADGGVFTRCRATVRQGQGVKDCPLEVEGAEVSHVVGLKGIAEAGGGIMRKPLGNGKYRDTYIMALPDGGYMTSTGHQERIYDRTGKLVPEIERRRERRREQREGRLPELNAMEQWQVDEEYAALQEQVTRGLLEWDSTEGKSFRDEAMNAAEAAEKKLYTSESLPLLLEVFNRHNTPAALKPALRAVKTDITDAPEPRAYLIQKAREDKRQAQTPEMIEPVDESPKETYEEYVERYKHYVGGWVDNSGSRVGSGRLSFPLPIRVWHEATESFDSGWYREVASFKFTARQDPRKLFEKYVEENRSENKWSDDDIEHARRYVSEFYDSEVGAVRDAEAIDAALGQSSKARVRTESLGKVRIDIHDLQVAGWQTKVSVENDMVFTGSKNIDGHQVTVLRRYVEGGQYSRPNDVVGKPARALLEKNPSLTADLPALLKGDIESAGDAQSRSSALKRIRNDTTIPLDIKKEVIRFWNDSISRWNS